MGNVGLPFVVFWNIALSLAGPCSIDLDSRVSRNEPFILDSNNRVLYPENGSRIITVADKGRIALYCHGTAKRSSSIDKLTVPALSDNLVRVPLTCKSGKFVYDGNGKTVNVLNADCTGLQQPEMTKTFTPCSTIGADNRSSGLDQLFSAKIRWNFNGAIYDQIEVCADEKIYGTLWVKYTLRGKSINYRDMDPDRPSFRIDTTNEARFFSKSTSTSVNNAYTKSNEADMMKKLLNTNGFLFDNTGANSNILIVDINSSVYYLARGHIAPDANFFHYVEQNATYYFMNVVPQFQSFNNGNWKSIEGLLRKYAATKQTDVTIYTGTYGVLTFPNSSGNPTNTYILSISSENYIPIPKYMWTLIYNPDSFEAVVFIGLNDPYAALSSDPGLNFCASACASITGVTKDFGSYSKGAFQCCQVTAELRGRIPHLPNLADANNNWPTLITSF